MRFLFELIQNSDDAYKDLPTKNPLLRLAMIDQHYLIVANYGKGFDERDVRGVCGVGSGTKRQDREKTGYKGLGFKAVFGQSNYVLIASKGEYFRFAADAAEFQWNPRWGKDRASWEAANGQKFEYPWQICPIWTEKAELPKCLGHELVRDYISQTSSPPLRLPANPFVHNHHRLRNLGIRQFTWEMCWNMLQSPWLLTRLTAERGIIFINYLYEQRELTQFKKRLYDIPFLLDQFGHLRKVTETYFPSRFSSADWLMVEDMDAFVHPTVMDWL
ncbi:unnamed protein product, partial [Rotaria sp. Silwood1]